MWSVIETETNRDFFNEVDYRDRETNRERERERQTKRERETDRERVWKREQATPISSMNSFTSPNIQANVTEYLSNQFSWWVEG